MNHHHSNRLFAQRGIKLHRLADQVINRAGRFNASESAASGNKREQLSARGLVLFQGSFF